MASAAMKGLFRQAILERGGNAARSTIQEVR